MNTTKKTASKKKLSIPQKESTPNFAKRLPPKKQIHSASDIRVDYIELVKHTLREHLYNVLSPKHFTSSLIFYAQMLPYEDWHSIKEMVIEDIKREVDDLIKQINNL